jgi:hypothetical protein
MPLLTEGIPPPPPAAVVVAVVAAADDTPGTLLLANAARNLASTSLSRAAVEVVDVVFGIATIVDSTLDANDPANNTRLDPIDFAFAAIPLKSPPPKPATSCCTH